MKGIEIAEEKWMEREEIMKELRELQELEEEKELMWFLYHEQRIFNR
jgi:hypothetical protein